MGPLLVEGSNSDVPAPYMILILKMRLCFSINVTTMTFSRLLLGNLIIHLIKYESSFFYPFSHGDFNQVNLKKNPPSRNVPICKGCLENARKESYPAYTVLTQLLTILDSAVELDTESCDLMEQIFVKIAAILSKRFVRECTVESKSVITHQLLKSQSKNLDFLSHHGRDKAFINALLAMAGQNVMRGNNELEQMSKVKLESLCHAYESLMGLANSNLTTAPAVSRNLQLLKATHSKDLLRRCGFPTGGSYPVLQRLAVGDLPELNPPVIGDFVSADDNIQV